MHPRAEVLSRALRITTQERNKSYGDPVSNMNAAQEFINHFWNIWEDSKKQYPEPAFRHAMDNILAKLVRIAHGDHQHEDNYTDICGYTGIAWECVSDLELTTFDDEAPVCREFVSTAKDTKEPSPQNCPSR